MTRLIPRIPKHDLASLSSKNPKEFCCCEKCIVIRKRRDKIFKCRFLNNRNLIYKLENILNFKIKNMEQISFWQFFRKNYLWVLLGMVVMLILAISSEVLSMIIFFSIIIVLIPILSYLSWKNKLQ